MSDELNEEVRRRKREYQREWRRKKIESDPDFLARESRRTSLWQQRNRDRINAKNAAKREEVREYHKQWRDRNRDRVRAYHENHKQEHGGAVAARLLLNKAIRRGEVVRPTQCQQCERLARGRWLNAHHEDYGRPLDVVWLCTECHGKQHRKAG